VLQQPPRTDSCSGKKPLIDRPVPFPFSLSFAPPFQADDMLIFPIGLLLFQQSLKTGYIP
jgi:hypothetical protein